MTRSLVVGVALIVVAGCAKTGLRSHERDGSAADGGSTDAGASDAGGADAGGADAGSFDAGVFDAGEPGAAVDVVGAWHHCSLSLDLRADGSLSRTLIRNECTSGGTWTITGNQLTLVFAPGCDGDGEFLFTATRVARGLVLVRAGTGDVMRLADDATPRVFWRLEGTIVEIAMRGDTTAYMVGDPEDDFGSGCYWSTDRGCGGLFSCGGQIVAWDDGTDAFRGQTICMGPCPCGGVSVGTVLPDGSIQARYWHSNCEGNRTGVFTARVVPRAP